MPWIRRGDAAYAALVLAAAAVMIFFDGRIDMASPDYETWDLWKYLAMARAFPHQAHVIQPFAYRLLGPWLAGLFRGHEIFGFRFLTVAFSLALPVGLYLFLLGHQIRPRFAAITAVLFVTNKWLFGLQAWNDFQLNDLLAQCLLLAMFRAMEHRNWIMFAAAMFLGIAARETALLMIPVAGVYLWQTGQLRRELMPFAAALVAPLVAFVAIRLKVHPSGGQSLLSAFITFSHKLKYPGTWFHLGISPFIPASLLPLIFLRTTVRFFRERLDRLLFVVLVFISALFGSDNERLLTPTFIIFLLLIAVILQHHFAPWPGAIAVLVVAAIIAGCDFRIGRWPLSIPLAQKLEYISLGIVTFLGIILRMVGHGTPMNPMPRTTER